MSSSVEAVIISGPRRGEIIQLPDATIPEASDEELQALNEALDALMMAIDHVATEVRITLEALSAQVGESSCQA